jgi:hypothetical protein
MTNPYGITLDEASLRWAAAEGVPEAVIAAICLLDQKSVDEIVAKLSPVELEQIIKIVGRSPRAYPPGALEALKGKRNLTSLQAADRDSDYFIHTGDDEFGGSMSRAPSDGWRARRRTSNGLKR